MDNSDIKRKILNDVLKYAGGGWAQELKAKYKPTPAAAESAPAPEAGEPEAEVDLSDLSILGDVGE